MGKKVTGELKGKSEKKVGKSCVNGRKLEKIRDFRR